MHSKGEIFDLYKINFGKASRFRLSFMPLVAVRQERCEAKHEDLPMIAQYELKLMHDHLQRVCKIQDVIIRFIPVIEKQYIIGRAPR